MAAEKEEVTYDDEVFLSVSDETKGIMEDRLGLMIYGFCKIHYGLPDMVAGVPADVMHIMALYSRQDPEEEKFVLQKMQKIAHFFDADFKDFEKCARKYQSWWAWFKSPDYKKDKLRILEKNKISKMTAETKKKDQNFLQSLFK